MHAAAVILKPKPTRRLPARPPSLARVPVLLARCGCRFVEGCSACSATLHPLWTALPLQSTTQSISSINQSISSINQSQDRVNSRSVEGARLRRHVLRGAVVVFITAGALAGPVAARSRAGRRWEEHWGGRLLGSHQPRTCRHMCGEPGWRRRRPMLQGTHPSASSSSAPRSWACAAWSSTGQTRGARCGSGRRWYCNASGTGLHLCNAS